MSAAPFTVYFLCTGNSCRSQMAEGWARFLGGSRVTAWSGGVEAHGVNPRAVAVMREAGVDISRQTSDVMDPARVLAADYVITLCGEAEEACPVTPPHVKRLHWGLPDPARAQGTDEEVLEVFRAVRDAIRVKVADLLDERR